MKKSLYTWQIIGFIFTCIAGVILHFLFDWTKNSVIVAPFSAVNESIWEHMKLLFFPLLAFAFVENQYIGKKYKSFWCVKLIGIVSGTIFIPVLYYTINGVFGLTPDFVNIAMFFVVSAISYMMELWLLKQNIIISCKSSKTSVRILILIALLFAVLTFIPPHIPLFEDPITNTYGYWQVV